MEASFSECQCASKKRQTRRDRFLVEIGAMTPWGEFVAAIERDYPRRCAHGRPPIGLERVLRMCIAQKCFRRSDEGIEDANCDSQTIRRFLGIDLGRETTPDATTLLKFRRLLEDKQLTNIICTAIEAHLAAKGLFLRRGTMVDSTIIEARPSTKKEKGERDPEMHQAKKGDAWHFGMKPHIGVDAESGLVHTVIGTAANVANVTQAQDLLLGDETDVFADAGYKGAAKREESLGTPVNWHAAVRKGKRRELAGQGWAQKLEWIVVNSLFRHHKTRYRSMTNTTAQLHTLLAMANLMLARRMVLNMDARGALAV